MLQNCSFAINSTRKMIISYLSKPLDIKYLKKTQL
ncbi:Uncharacterised protein [Lacrimispora sphenoides]|uniref:Uncharacterized protein n=1 Tax=Lacrimispora sphenoides JCM 1415 TaxID=1297793 RepID=A0ABY1C4I1_9FIRM|nr:hypothetical protein SAMN02745906_0880 [[Clostridium] sphenoides JCM 1415]SUY50259.1 Uncharacterised protein [Lacrimispora sphenoides]